MPSPTTQSVPAFGQRRALSKTAFAEAKNSSSDLVLSWLPPMGLYGLSLVNALLSIVTLGIYSFWAKTEVRRRIWSAVRLSDEPLQYTGNGKELFLGFLIIFGIVLLPVLLASIAVVLTFGPNSLVVAGFQISLYAVFAFLIGLGTYRAQRYRLSRTRWRGIRGAVVGNGLHYAWTYLWTAALIPLTLGWIIPWRTTKLRSQLTADMRFGSHPFRFDAKSGALYVRFAVLWIAMAIVFTVGSTIITQLALIAHQNAPLNADPSQARVVFGAASITVICVGYLLYQIFAAWYRAGMINHFARHTHYEQARFHGTASAGGLIWIGLTNVLIVVFSLGVLWPIAEARATRYLVDHLEIVGHVGVDNITQATEQDIRRGEGLAEAFDIDAF